MSEIYDYDTLIRGRETILNNIKAMEKALETEKAKLAEYNKHIAKAEAILEMHGELPKQ